MMRPGSVVRCAWRRAMPLALGLVACVALAACGDLPRPFQPADKSAQAWLGPGDVAWGSILVPPIAGLPAHQSAVLVDELVKALHLRDVPADTHAGGRGSIVLGRARLGRRRQAEVVVDRAGRRDRAPVR